MVVLGALVLLAGCSGSSAGSGGSTGGTSGATTSATTSAGTTGAASTTSGRSSNGGTTTGSTTGATSSAGTGSTGATTSGSTTNSGGSSGSTGASSTSSSSGSGSTTTAGTSSGSTGTTASTAGTTGGTTTSTGGLGSGVVLISDINQSAGADLGSSPHDFEEDPLLGAFFVASDSRNGAELWHTDLTAAGTHLVVDLVPGPTGSNPRNITYGGPYTYFVATTPELGDELWKTDGTAAGTTLVADLSAGAASTTFQQLIEANNRLYFLAKVGSTTSLWQTDGTAASTVTVPLNGFTSVKAMATASDSLFVIAHNGSNDALLRIDSGGTTTVYQSGLNYLSTLTPIGSYAYYVDQGTELRRANAVQKTDALFASMASTVNGYGSCPAANIAHIIPSASGKVVFDIHAYVMPSCSINSNAGSDHWYVATSSSVTALSGYSGINGAYQDEQYATRVSYVGANLYFVVWTCPWNSTVCGNGGTSAESTGTKTLWKFDGTTATQVASLGYGAYFDQLQATSSGVYWIGPASQSGGTPSGSMGDALWANGAPMGISKANGWSGLSILPGAVNGGFYFAGDNGSGASLWYLTGGTTTPVQAAPTKVDPANYVVVGLWGGFTNTYYYLTYAGDDGSTGVEPWTSPAPTTPGVMPTGTTELADVMNDPGSSNPIEFTDYAGSVYFTANDGQTGSELWKTDGTGAGTSLVKDIWAGSDSSGPSAMSVINGVLYFAANDGYTGTEFWSSLGAGSNTQLVTDIYGGLYSTPSGSLPNSSLPGPFVSLNSKVIFPATAGPAWNTELYGYSGTGAPGTVSLVKAINPDPDAGSDPTSLEVVNGKLFLIANDGTHGTQLWVSDGTSAGTSMVKTTSQSTDSLAGSYLYPVGQQVYFAAKDPTAGRELWVSDGTVAGTQRTDDINASGDSNPDSFAELNGTLYFAATDSSGDRELWSKAGSAAATRVTDLNPSGSSNPAALVVSGTTLFFTADDGTHGRELCALPAGGSVSCQDILPGVRSSGIAGLLPIGSNKVVFAASDGVNGMELWESDGTSAGTRMVSDVAPGPASSNPAGMTVSSTLQAVLFQSDDGVNGVELRGISLSSL